MTYLFGLPMSAFDPSDDRLLVVTQCAADPGMCDEWEPFAGGNRAYLLPAGRRAGNPLKRGPKKLEGDVVPLAVVIVDVPDPGPGPEADLDEDAAFQDVLPDEAVGLIGGSPWWTQDDETPECDCGTTMRFVVQLSAAAHPDLNLGGGDGYAFVCPSCPDSAAWLYQC